MNTLRFLLAALVFALIGSGLTTTEANADDLCPECPKSVRYWGNNPHEWPVSHITLGNTAYSKHDAIDILELEWPGVSHRDTMLKLGQQLIAAKLNMYSGVDANMVANEMNGADAMLVSYPFGALLTNAERAYARSMIIMMMDFNNGDLGTLAVELTSFQGRTDDATVLLTWTTTSESDNAGFEVQMLGPTDTEFESVTFVPGAGTSSRESDYSLRVSDVNLGTSVFRLKLMDTDGAHKYSEAIEVTIEPNAAVVLGSAYPNPVQTSATISVALSNNDEADLAVFDLLGRRVKSVFSGTLSAGSHDLVLDVSDLPGGIYLYRLSTGSRTDTGTVSVIR